ncbi:methylase [Pseudoalteromonas sp. A25]|uniref:DUF938 domain-containing protein n=1 Tax=Pseudoalteromonas sp. A25 TaxID=116092 RepID=UPI00126104DC|nr:DUF938 domain-containing protein [Pseudoalteromonas sp. A25]BBN80051.1 methylase [Pseudoalteromonas sp. A25]
MDKPFSQACENNKAPILSVIEPYLRHYDYVLEVGSGTGQHAVYFSEQLPHLRWQTSDREQNHGGICSWIEQSCAQNVLEPIRLDLNHPWPVEQVPVIYTANTLHIVSKVLVDKFFQSVKAHLANGGLLCIYGPFNYQGHFTSDSNAQFDAFLKANDSDSGIRDFEWINSLAQQAGLSLLKDQAMPANNRLLLFKR